MSLPTCSAIGLSNSQVRWHTLHIDASGAEGLWALAAPAGPSWGQLENSQHFRRRRAAGLQHPSLAGTNLRQLRGRHRLKGDVRVLLIIF